MKDIGFYCGVVFLFMSSWVMAQIDSPYRPQRSVITLDSCAVKLSEFTVLPTSVSVTWDSLLIEGYVLKNNILIFENPICEQLRDKELDITFRTFGFNFEKPYYTIDSSLLSYHELMIGGGYNYNPFAVDNAIIQSQGLDYRGSFTRGLSIGNNQSLVPNSNFDMQLLGDLGNGLKVVAAISDDNLPIQAQGNTQQLQEFD